jgi:hypothetical protein
MYFLSKNVDLKNQNTVHFLGTKRPRRGLYRPPSSSAEVKERVEIYFYSPSGPSWLVTGEIYLIQICISFLGHSERSSFSG